MVFSPNALNEYDTYTYNIQLFVVKPEFMNDVDAAIKGGNALLLADNARIAKFNIAGCEQVFAISHDQVREAIGSKFNLRIQEPNGINLIASIRQLCNQLGILNHIRAGFIIAIEFNGRNSEGLAKKFPQTFYYPCVVKHFDFAVDEGGTTYNVQLVENGSAAYEYAANVIQNQIVVEAQTVGEFVDRFTERLNATLERSWALNPSISAGIRPDIYDIRFDESTEAWREWRFEILDQDFEVNGASFVGRPGDNPSLQVIASTGTQITTLMSQVLQLTAEYKQILINNGGSLADQYMRPAPEEPTSRQMDVFPVFFKMIGNIEYSDYDQYKGEYTRTNVFTIKAYTATNQIIDGVTYATSISNPGIQESRLGNLIAGNFLRKKYDYYYTGENTEVLNLDLQFNYAYFQVIPNGDGWWGDADVLGGIAAGDLNTVQQRFEQVSIAKKNQANAQRNLDQAINSNVSGGAEIGFLQLELNKATSFFRSAAAEANEVLSGQFRFSPNDIDYAVRFREDTITDSVTFGSENNNRSGGLKMGAVRVNLESMSDLAKIELEVRGDPYWMGKPNTLYNQQQNIDDLADFEAGAPSFFLNVNLPVQDEDESGRRKPTPENQISGIYVVKTVINKFENGQFVQYLSAVRDLGSNIATVREQLEGDTSVLDQLANLRDRARGNQISQLIENARRGLRIG